MSTKEEVFRFSLIRPPEAIQISDETPVMTVPKVVDIEEAKVASRLLDKKLEKVDPSDSIAIDKIFSNMDVISVLPAVLRYARSAKTINITVQKASTLRFPEHSPTIDEPFIVDLEEDLLPSDVVDSILSQRKSYFGPVGVGDLMIVEQKLKGYSLGEIAHIENVMPKELRDREHTARSEFEIFQESETETSDFSEKHLESNERFEIKKSAQTEIESREKLSIGVQVNASLPNVELGSSFDYSKENSKKAANEAASTFARDVTEKAISRTEERVRTLQSTRQTNTTEVRNQHKFDNGTTEDIVGIYRYVTKNYRMRLTKRAPRFFYEFIVPQPGRFLLELMETPEETSDQLQELKTKLQQWEDKEPSIDQFEFDSYPELVNEYELLDITIPPESLDDLPKYNIAITLSDIDTGAEGSQSSTLDGTLDIPQGYKAMRATVTFTVIRVQSVTKHMIATVGGQTRYFSNTAPEVVELGGLIGKVSYSLLAMHDDVIAATIDVECEPITDGREQWSLDFLSKMLASRAEKILNIQTQIDAIEAQSRVEQELNFSPDSPEMLRSKERTELKRLCLQLLGQEAQQRNPEINTPLFMEHPSDNANFDNTIFPIQHYIDLQTLQRLSKEVRFGEQAFEWHNISYTLYPYFWNQRRQWPDKASIKHPDNEHEEFLKSGYVRVLVPVRENWEEVVRNFLFRGIQALDFTDTLTVTDPLWLPLYTELREKQNASDEEFEVVDRWDADVPTNLVMLSGREEDLPEIDLPSDWV